jgi:16S rRNA (cytosine1402-N4)-methyltransferase
MDHQKIHTPVLLKEVLTYLAPEKGQRLLDVTAGYGGHANQILEITGYKDQSILVDRDENAVNQLIKRFAKKNVSIIHRDFAAATKQLYEQNQKFDLILADLGVSSPHLDNASRGFSFMLDGPLDMRMDQSTGLSAADLVNTASQETIETILRKYGEEPRAHKIAEAIVRNRPITSTQALAHVIATVYGGRGRYKTHPATKSFQALRIAVNDELTQLEYALPLWMQMLRVGGKLAVISFHSLEDRIVKRVLSEYGGNRYDAELHILTKKPITGSAEELAINPRARSAKLRVAVKK